MPDFRPYIREHLPPLAVGGAREAEIVEELALQLEEVYQRAIRRGLPVEAAWVEVREQAPSWAELVRELQSALPARPETDPRPNPFLRFWDELRHDLRFGARQLIKSPGFTTVAVLLLALGIGANTAIFSLLDAILLRDLPVRQPEQLYFFGKVQSEGTTRFLPHGSTQAFSYPFFREFRRRNQVFSEVAAIQSYLVPAHGRVAGDRDLEKINVELVSGTYFRALGVNAVRGRVLNETDDRTSCGHPIAVAGYSWWQNRLARDPSVVGKTVTIGATAYTIVGVAPPGFFGVTVGRSPNLWIPLAMQKQIDPDEDGLEDNLFRFLHLIGRLKPGITQQQARANTDLVFRQILREYLGPQPSQQEMNNIQHSWIDLIEAATGRSPLRAQFSSPLRVLMAVVALVLLIACANLTTLLLARAKTRERDLAIRMSLGAGRPRLVRELLVESACMGCGGAALGVAFAWGVIRLLLATIARGSELAIRVAPDSAVLGFTAALTVLTVLLFGAAPSLRATGLDLAASLRDGRGAASAQVRNRLARSLVLGQVALSLVLLAGAGLFLRSLANLIEINLGFDKQNVLRLTLDPAAAGYQPGARLSALQRDIEERVGSLLGAESVSFAMTVFDGGGWSEDDVSVPGRAPTENHPVVDFNVIGPRYFDVMKMPVVMGRSLGTQDNAASRNVAVINQTMTRVYFAGASPLGRTFSIGDDPEWQNLEVVGVVRDAKYMNLEEKQMPAAFFPHAQHGGHFLYNLVVRYTGDPASLVGAARKRIESIDPNLPVSDVRTLSEMVDDFALNRRLVARLATSLGILGALLACIGIYGVVSYSVTRRTNEFGIRMALGAGRRHVVWVVLRESLSLVIAGAAAGLVLALASSRLVESLLFGVRPHDPAAIGWAAVAMIAVALCAGLLPARRATQINPATALRCG